MKQPGARWRRPPRTAAEAQADRIRRGLVVSESFVVLAVACLGAGSNAGIFQPGGVALIVVAALLCGLALVAPRGDAHVAVWILALLICADGFRATADAPWAGLLAVLGVVVLLGARARGGLLLPALVVGSARSLARNWTWGHKDIDVLGFIQGAAGALLHGTNPYTPTFPSVVEGVSLTYPVHFPYGPSVILLAVPGAALGDVRVMSLVLVLATLACVAAYAWREVDRFRTVRVTALALAFPLSALVILSAWVDAYSLGTFALWLVLRRRHRRIAMVALALSLATKPTIWIAALVPFVWSRRARLEIVVAGLGAAVITLPFVIMTGVHQFYYDVAGVHLDLYPIRTDALTFNALLHWLGHGFLPSWTSIVVGVLLVGLVAWRRPRDAGDHLLLAGLVSIVAFLFGKEAFTNYYWAAAVLLLFAVAGRGVAFDALPPSRSHAGDSPALQGTT